MFKNPPAKYSKSITMSKVLAVFGATGQQGGSIISHVLSDPELSQEYKIRAITRNVTSEKAQKLKGKVEVVQADASNRVSLEKALTGAHTIFVMTTQDFSPNAAETEYNNGKRIANVAVEKDAKYIIFSTLPPVTKISGGKFTQITMFETKGRIERYIRNLEIKSAFFCGGSFMQNFHTQTFLKPREAHDGTWMMVRNVPPNSQVPLLDVVEDTGKFVGAILADPDKYEGKTFCAATTLYSLEEVADIVSKTTGKTVIYRQVPAEEYKKSIPFAADIFISANSYAAEFGYFGPDSKKLVAWAAENARGRLNTLEEYFEAHPVQFT